MPVIRQSALWNQLHQEMEARTRDVLAHPQDVLRGARRSTQPLSFPGLSGSPFGQQPGLETNFGQSSSSASAFGGGVFGGTKSAFGQTPGQTSFACTPTPAFGTGASAFGQQSAFGTSSQPTQTSSAFGASAPKPAFGQSAFGTASAFGGTASQSSQPPVTSAFGGSNLQTVPSASASATLPIQSTSAFQQSTGASSNSSSVFGTASSNPTQGAFGSGQSAFGGSFGAQQPKPTAFGQSAFGQSALGRAAFGQSAFGQSSQPASVPGQSTGGTSAFSFAAASSSPSGNVFGSGASSAFQAAASKPVSSGFGTSAFGASAFGQNASASQNDPPVLDVELGPEDLAAYSAPEFDRYIPEIPPPVHLRG